MNCHTQHHSGTCCHGNGGMHPQLWSRAKKIKILRHQLECLEEQKKDVEEALKELEADT